MHHRPSRAAAFRKAIPRHRRLFPAGSLRGSRLGTPFRRQVVLGRHIVDFLAPRARGALEVDGEVHAQRGAADARRDRDLASCMGYRACLPRLGAAGGRRGRRAGGGCARRGRVRSACKRRRPREGRASRSHARRISALG
ncbi:MAG: DUF559 domain-containing protein [Polyangiaceae bacterium]|nr:DUF559 domain-containing protein [Polyangiaceae bacterium]